jgi:hypothetical protein
MEITIRASFLPHNDPEASWPSTATFSASRSATTSDEGMGWITVGAAGQPGDVHRPASASRRPAITDDEHRTIVEMIPKRS